MPQHVSHRNAQRRAKRGSSAAPTRQLYSHFSKRLGLPLETVEAFLPELVALIQREVERRGEFEIPGLMRFVGPQTIGSVIDRRPGVTSKDSGVASDGSDWRSFVWPDTLPPGISGFEDLSVLFRCGRENRGLIRMDLDEAMALFRLVRGIKNASGVEIGRFKGGGTFLIAAALTGHGHLLSIDIAPEDDEELDRVLTACRLRKRVEFVVGSSSVIERDDTYDFVVIDGDHSYSAARSDHVTWGAKLRVGGFVVHHDMGCARPWATQIRDLKYLKEQILHHQQRELVITEEVGSLVVFQRKSAEWTTF
jgi:predicted O-methyltransferase YrrM